MSSNDSQPGVRSGDKHTLELAEETLTGTSKQNWLKRMLPFLGPAFIASVAYVDPGNFATNISGGARFGLTLLWVIVASNLMAMLIQSLPSKRMPYFAVVEKEMEPVCLVRSFFRLPSSVLTR